MTPSCAGPPAVPPELAGSLGWLLARAGQLVGGALTAALAELEVTPRELSLLLAAAPQPRPQLGLAHVVGLDKSTMVSTVDALEARGLVRRESAPDDRRVRLVAVTPQGRALAERAARVSADVEAALLAGDADLRERLAGLVRRGVQQGGPPPGSCV
jgi:MarR family transcriptional regulator, transcriptional regulator for hemolysin